MKSPSMPHRPRLVWLTLIAPLAIQIPSFGANDNASTVVGSTGTSPVAARIEDRPLKLAEAVERYSRQITQMEPGKDRADLSLRFASLLEAGAASQSRPEWLERSGQIYRDVIASTQGEPRLRASNNYCAQLLRQKKPQEALQVMESEQELLRTSSLNPVARSRSLYNYGMALLLSGSSDRACEVLNEAVKADPIFAEAAQAAGDAAVQSTRETTGIPLMVELTKNQLVCQDYDGVARNLRQGLLVERWREHSLYPQLLRQLVRYFAAAQIRPEAFRQEWSPLLSQIRSTPRLPRDSQRMIEQIETVYSGPLPIMRISPEPIREFYGAVWAEPAVGVSREPNFAVLSSFIVMVADKYRQQRDAKSLRSALQRYCHAWGLNTRNMEAGLYVANLLLYDQSGQNRQLDPDNEVLNDFIGQLFEAKGQEYRRDLGRDWERILKCHIILATIFERQQRWGPAHEPTTAMFQWELADNALRKLDASASATKELLGPVVLKGLTNARGNLR